MVDRLQGISSGCTVKLIRKHFMRYGILEEVVNDGGPGFDNQIMRELAHRYGFKWNPSAVDMPNSDGMAESAVKQIKYIIRKCNNENSDSCLAILKLTNTPSKSAVFAVHTLLPLVLQCFEPIDKKISSSKYNIIRGIFQTMNFSANPCI